MAIPLFLSDEEAVQKFLLEEGEKPYRFGQVMHALYKTLISEIGEITVLPQTVLKKLEDTFSLSSLSVYKEIASQDNQTTKVLFKTHDGMLFEGVLMRHLTDRITVCVSSQAGCAVGCSFCATGKLGFKRNLTYFEIVDQVTYFNRLLHKEGKRVRNVVFMGMGEPLLNYRQVKRSIEIMMDQKKHGIGNRHLTVSTSGILPGIRSLIKDKLLVNLAISLHAPNEALRSKIMKINDTYSLRDLMSTLNDYIEATNKRIFYEYVMLEGVNDHEKEAHELGKLLKGTLAHVNLIPFNSPEKLNEERYKRSRKEVMQSFQAILQIYGVPSTIRVSLGQDIAAACGQLALEEKDF